VECQELAPPPEARRVPHQEGLTSVKPLHFLTPPGQLHDVSLNCIQLQPPRPAVPISQVKMSNALKTAQNRLSALASTLTGGSSQVFPAFDDLPKVEGQPQGCIWGLFDTEGKKDEVGSQSPPPPFRYPISPASTQR